MKPTIQKPKNIRGRITGYSARIGEVEAQGETLAEATEKCEREVSNALSRLDRGGLIATWQGHTYGVFPTINGWEYWLDTFSHIDYRQGHDGTREDVQDRALHHLAQNVWSLAVPIDDEFIVGLPKAVATEILAWCRWQRRFAALRDEGKTLEECHRLASSEELFAACAS
jgi:hypothetical protein